MPFARKLAKAGRPAKPGQRYDNGRLIPPKKEETIAQRQAIVLAQPHRRSADPHGNGRASLVGRLVADGRIRANGLSGRTLERAADLYAKAWADMRWVMDSKRPYGLTGGRGRAEPTESDRRAIERRWGDLSACVRDCGPLVVKALEYAVLDSQPEDYEPPFWVVYGTGIGLAAIAKHEGLD